MTGWRDLSDDELQARVEQRGFIPTLRAAEVVARRDELEVFIDILLDEAP